MGSHGADRARVPSQHAGTLAVVGTLLSNFR